MDDLQKHSLLTGCLCALGCESLYGLSYVFTKLATSAGADGSAPALAAFFRRYFGQIPEIVTFVFHRRTSFFSVYRVSYYFTIELRYCQSFSVKKGAKKSEKGIDK